MDYTKEARSWLLDTLYNEGHIDMITNGEVDSLAALLQRVATTAKQDEKELIDAAKQLQDVYNSLMSVKHFPHDLTVVIRRVINAVNQEGTP